MARTAKYALLINFALICFITQLWFVEVLASMQPKAFQNDNETVIAVMGATGSGKTTLINLASGSTLRVGGGLKSCTNAIQTSKPFEFEGRRVVLIDTPGFDDTNKSDADILHMIAHYLAVTYERGMTLAGVIYLHRISDVKMGGISQRNFHVFRELCGNSTLQNVVIVTNMWGDVNQTVGEAREHELATEESFFGSAISHGAELLRHHNTIQSAQAVLRHIVHNRPLPLRIQQELVDEHMDLGDTGAGSVLFRDLKAQAQKHRKELEEMMQKMEGANEETKKVLGEEIRKRQQEMDRRLADMQKMQQDFAVERAKLLQAIEDKDDGWGFFDFLAAVVPLLLL